ncbi:MAG TPA: hypothetical protein EYQ81_11655, partial [Sneathiellales bacterium]|nr:hypothetical protein [Sneathiellales bacterium]
MDKQFYTDANVLVFDQKLHLRKQTRSILNIIGFWKIRECENLAEASQALMGRQFDLAILTMHDRRDGVSAWVNNVRQFRCGDDPFLPIILTSWDAR